MLHKQDLIYRQLVTLKDGARVLLRPLVPDDRQSLIELFEPLEPDELRFFRTKVTDRGVVGSWVDHLDYEKVLPIVAVIGDRIVGDTTLHFNSGPSRHIGEVRIFMSKDFRTRGLGAKMLQSIIDIGKRRNLHYLTVEVVADQVNMVRAFQNVGFVLKCTYENFFMLPDGELRDLAHLVLRLRNEDDAF